MEFRGSTNLYRKSWFGLHQLLNCWTLTARGDHGFGRSSGLFGEDLQNYNGIGINTVYQTPLSTAVIDPQLMASCTMLGIGRD
jgi:hypothetical protein